MYNLMNFKKSRIFYLEIEWVFFGITTLDKAPSAINVHNFFISYYQPMQIVPHNFKIALIE